MKLKNLTTFHICGLNQEKLLNELCKKFTLTDIDRHTKNSTSFKCSYFEHAKIEKTLKNSGVKIESVVHEGIAYKLSKIFTSYGLVAAIVVFVVLFALQNQYILQYDVIGQDKLSQLEIVDFVKERFSAKKSEIDTKQVETCLLDNFSGLSFASCIIKGQTLVINIKEKLLPQEMYGQFAPLVAQKDGKITQISLISGTLRVKVGDIVQKGDVLVEPYTIDTSGQLKKVEAKAQILAEVYNEGSVDHYETFIEVNRTGKTAVQDDIRLFGLSIYTFKEDMNFKMYEVEFEDIDLSKNFFLPFKMRKTTYFELEERTIESKFEDVQEEYIEKAKAKALENCEDCDKIKEEFYTLRHLSGVTVVNFCIVTEEDVGGY